MRVGEGKLIDTAPDLRGVYVGCAGWGIPKEQAYRFPEPTGGGSHLSHLERYARRLPAVEINSSFYRSHRPATYRRWAAAVPDAFRFSVKMPRQITHARGLREPDEPLARFLTEVASLGDKLGPILVQLPPRLAFDPPVVRTFFAALRSRYPGSVVCEPRHPSWFEPESEQILIDFRIARVAADPPVPVPEAARPGGWASIVYYRLHGSPRIYSSSYPNPYLEELAAALVRGLRRGQNAATAAIAEADPTGAPDILTSARETWCIFDNTTRGAAAANALDVLDLAAGRAGMLGNHPSCPSGHGDG